MVMNGIVTKVPTIARPSGSLSQNEPEHHGKGDHAKGREQANAAKQHWQTAHQYSEFDPSCEAFVCIIVERAKPNSRLDANWGIRGVKFGKANRDKSNEALTSIVERMQHEFSLSEDHHAVRSRGSETPWSSVVRTTRLAENHREFGAYWGGRCIGSGYASSIFHLDTWVALLLKCFSKGRVMPLSDDRDQLIEHTLAAVQAAALRISPKEKWDSESMDFANRMADLKAQQQRFRLLDEHCNEAVAKIRASLKRADD